MTLPPVLRKYITDPEALKTINDILAFKFHGFTVPQMTAAVFVLTLVIFFFPGRDPRDMSDKLMDFVLLWLCLAVFVLCLGGGMLVGKHYDYVGVGTIAGLAVSFFFFKAVGNIRQSYMNRKDRAAFAKRMQKGI